MGPWQIPQLIVHRIQNLRGGGPLAPVSMLDCLRLNDTNGKEPFQISLAPNP